MRFAAALALVVSLPLAADADPARAWAAAKAQLPSGTANLVGVNVDKVTSATMFRLAMPFLLGQQPEVKKVFELMKSECKLDPLAFVDGIVVGTDKQQTAGAVYIAVDGVDEASLVACAIAIGKKLDPKKPEVAVVRDGAITELSFDGKKIATTWIGKDVFVVPFEMGDKAMLKAWTGGKGAVARGTAGKLAAKTDMRAAFWVVQTSEREVEKKQMKSGFGAIDLAGGQVKVTGRMSFAAAADAKEIAKSANDQITQLMMNGSLDASLLESLKKFSITAAGTDVVLKGAIAESDLMSLIGGAMGGG